MNHHVNYSKAVCYNHKTSLSIKNHQPTVVTMSTAINSPFPFADVKTAGVLIPMRLWWFPLSLPCLDIPYLDVCFLVFAYFCCFLSLSTTLANTTQKSFMDVELAIVGYEPLLTNMIDGKKQRTKLLWGYQPCRYRVREGNLQKQIRALQSERAAGRSKQHSWRGALTNSWWDGELDQY